MICLLFGAHLQANAMWMKSIGLFETIFSSSKTMPNSCNMVRNCLQAGHVIPPCLSFRILTHLQLITLEIFQTVRHMTYIPSQLPHNKNITASWSNNGNAFHRGRGTQTSSEHAQSAHRMH